MIVTVTPCELRVTGGFPALRGTRAWQRWQVDQPDVGRSYALGLRELRIHFHDQPPLVLMTGWPAEHVRAAAQAIAGALGEVAPHAQAMRPDDTGILRYAGPGRPYRIEVRALPEGVSVTVPPLPCRTIAAVGILCFITAWLGTVVSMFLPEIRRGAFAVIPFAAIFVGAGLTGLVSAAVAFVRRHEPIVLAATPAELFIDDPARVHGRRRTMPASSVGSVELAWAGKNRGAEQPVLRITPTDGRKPIDLLAGRDEEEIQRVAGALGAVLKPVAAAPPA